MVSSAITKFFCLTLHHYNQYTHTHTHKDISVCCVCVCGGETERERGRVGGKKAIIFRSNTLRNAPYADLVYEYH